MLASIIHLFNYEIVINPRISKNNAQKPINITHHFVLRFKASHLHFLIKRKRKIQKEKQQLVPNASVNAFC